MGIDRPFGNATSVSREELIAKASRLVGVITEHPAARHEELYLCYKLKLNERRQKTIEVIISHLRNLCTALDIAISDESSNKERLEISASLSKTLNRGVVQ